MEDVFYAILEITPVPGHWVPVPLYRLQAAEFNIFKDQKSYYERALCLPSRNSHPIYAYDDARQLLQYLECTCDFAVYKLMGVIVSEAAALPFSEN